MKKQIEKIWMDKAEGQNMFEVTVNDMQSANQMLTMWATTIHEDCQGYEKVDFIITWENGEEYTGRYDLQRNEQADLAKHVSGFLKYLATKADEGIYGKGSRAEAVEFIETYEVA